MKELITIYRKAWKSSGYPGSGKVMLAHHMFCHDSNSTALEIARAPLNRYLRSLVEAASMWIDNKSSDDYPGYDKIIKALSNETADSQISKSAAFIGSPEKIVDQITEYQASTGGFDIASLQINFNDLDVTVSEHSMRLFSERVMPFI